MRRRRQACTYNPPPPALHPFSRLFSPPVGIRDSHEEQPMPGYTIHTQCIHYSGLFPLYSISPYCWIFVLNKPKHGQIQVKYIGSIGRSNEIPTLSQAGDYWSRGCGNGGNGNKRASIIRLLLLPPRCFCPSGNPGHPQDTIQCGNYTYTYHTQCIYYWVPLSSLFNSISPCCWILLLLNQSMNWAGLDHRSGGCGGDGGKRTSSSSPLCFFLNPHFCDLGVCV